MEAKDTAMTNDQIRFTCLGEGFVWVGELNLTATASQPVLMPQFRRLVNKQAEITWDIAFKAGERKVVELLKHHWLEEHFLSKGSESGVSLPSDGTEYSRRLEDQVWWQEFLKSERIE